MLLAWLALSVSAQELPVLVDSLPAAYPAVAASEGREATVLLELDVLADGTVADVRVVEAAGAGFDEAAVAAARTFRFAPARDAGGQPVAARILYRYSFTLPGADVVVVASPGDEGTVVVTAARPVVGERALTAEAIRVLPGTNGDAVRVVQNLPGVARAPFDIGQLILRGTAPEDSAAYLDGQRVPLVFHFGGLSTVVNSDLLGEVALLPGGYGVRYGRTLGGVVELRAEEGLPDAPRRYVSVDVFQATAFFEQPVGERDAVTVSARRSYVDALLNPILNGPNGPTIRAPRYFDFQARWTHAFDDGGDLDVLFFNAYDEFRVVGSASDGEQAQAAIAYETWSEKLRVRYQRPIGAWRSETSLLVGPENQEFAFGEGGKAYERPVMAGLRQEVAVGAEEGGLPGVRLGADLVGGRYVYVYDLKAFGTVERDAAWSFAPAAYAELTVDRGAVEVVPGVRADGWWLQGGYDLVTVDPRLAARAEVGPTTTIAGTIGRYSQPPTPRQVLEGTGGDPTLTSPWALQASLGVEQRLGEAVSAEITAFDHELRDLVSGREDAFRFYTGPPPIGPLDTGAYANDGTGRVVGAEALVKLQTADTAAWISATLSRSTRTKRPGWEAERFTYDQPVVLTAVGTHAISDAWRVGARTRYATGIPYTPVVNRTYDLDTRAFEPVYAEPGSDRLPAFFALDLRIDRRWAFRRWALEGYLDLQNATNRANVEWMGFSWDYAEEEPITGFPILPTFGVKGEW